MNYTELKETIRRAYPESMIYEKAKNIKGGRWKMPTKRWVGYNRRRDFSVEVRGPEKNLSRLEFMIGLDDIQRAHMAFETAVAATLAHNPEWDGREWMLKQVGELEGGEYENVRLAFVPMEYKGQAVLAAIVKVVLS